MQLFAHKTPTTDAALTLRTQQKAPSSVLSKDQHQLIKNVQKTVPTGRKRRSQTMFTHVSQTEKIFFMDNLATMLTAGLSLSLALSTIQSETKSRAMRRALVEMKHSVDSGGQFSDALHDHPEIFSPLFVAVVRVGEATGSLADVLTRLAEIAKKNKSLQSKAINAMIYPAVVLIAMIAIIIVLMIYVFPQLIDIFKEVNVELPLQTRILIGTVNLVREQGLWVLLGFMALVSFLLIGLRIRPIKYMYHMVFLRLPLMGKIDREVVITRITGNLRLLLMSGVPIVQALSITARTAGNLVYETSLGEIAKEVELGQSLHDIVTKRPKLYPTLMATMFKVGEETGKFDEILGKLERFYDARVEATFANLSTIIEPVLLLSIGVMVGFIAVSVIMPIYNLAQAF